MKITYDSTVDAAYLHIGSLDGGAFAFTYACDPAVVKSQIHLDFDLAGRLMGMEIIPASKMLPESLLGD